jgi:hypothetical protein
MSELLIGQCASCGSNLTTGHICAKDQLKKITDAGPEIEKAMLTASRDKWRADCVELAEAVLHKDDDWHGDIWSQLVPSDGDVYSHFRCCHCFGTGWATGTIKHEDDCPVIKAAAILKGVRGE